MKKKDFAKVLAKKFDIAQDYALDITEAVFETLSETLDSGEDVYFYGFGTFKHETRKSKIVRHPKTGELMEIPSKEIIVFKRTVSNKDNSSDEE